MVSVKQIVLDCKHRLAFEFQGETAQTLKIYFVLVSDRDNRTILRMMASVKQTVDTKSRLAFEFKQESDLVRKLQCKQLLHSAVTTCT